jgi:hypothetical protein
MYGKPKGYKNTNSKSGKKPTSVAKSGKKPKTPKGMHRMPDGSLMKGEKHKVAKKPVKKKKKK